MTEIKNVEDMISDLMIFVHLKTIEFPMPKRHAVDRYMRTVLRSLTKMELKLALDVCKVNGFLDPDLAFKLDQAGRGYDRFMAKRGRH